MAYRILNSGVMQDHKGRYFRHAVYPNGKCIQVPAMHADEVTKLEPGYVIPQPKITVRPILKLTKKREEPTTRKAVTQHRLKGLNEVMTNRFNSAAEAQAFIDSVRQHEHDQIHTDLNTGKSETRTVIRQHALVDYMVQYHLDEAQPQPTTEK